MVGSEDHALRAGRPGALILAVEAVERAGVGLPLGDLHQRLGPGPAVAGVEAGQVKVAVIELAEHPDRLDRLDVATDVGPEVGRDIAGHIRAETVNIGLANPIGHRTCHLAAKGSVGVIEVDNV